MSAIVGTSAVVADLTVERGVNEARAGVLFVIFTTVVGVGVSVGFASSWWFGILAAVITAVATTLLIAAVYRVRVVRRVVMELMHRITGQ